MGLMLNKSGMFVIAKVKLKEAPNDKPAEMQCIYFVYTGVSCDGGRLL
jgi:hypothetical protein